MIGTIVEVIRGEGLASAARRAAERIEESLQQAAARVRGAFGRSPRAPILNYSATSIAPRTGGVAIQLLARLRAERELRNVALLHPRSPGDLRQALSLTGARAVHVEGTFNAPLHELIDLGVPLVVSVHDLSLLEAPRDLARRFLDAAAGVIFPSHFLRDRYRELCDRGEVIEPATPATPVEAHGMRRAIAYAGSVKRHKGAELLPDVAEMLATRGLALHVFGGGDADLFRPLRALPNVVVHGYYRAGALPSLLARHGVGLVVLPSIVPESYSLTLSEAWLAGAAVVAFDHGALAERIQREGGGWLAPLDSGATGLMTVIDHWVAGETVRIPRITATPADAARAHVELYRRWGLL